MAFQSKNSTITNLVFAWLIRVFLVEETLYPSTATIASWFQQHNHKPRLIPYYDVRKKIFITVCFGKQFLTDFNALHFLIGSQKAQHELWTDATRLNFSLKLSWHDSLSVSTSSVNCRKVKQQSQQEISRHFRRLLMRNIVQVWDLHRQKFCPP